MADATTSAPPDPFLKQNVLDDLRLLVRKTYAGNGQRQKALDELIMANYQLTYESSMHLMFRDKLHQHSSALPGTQPPRRLPRLHPDLLPQMEAWHAEDVALSQEQKVVLGALTAILNASNHVEDWRLLLPEYLHEVLRPYEACNPEAKRLSTEAIEAVRAKTFKGLLPLKQRMVLNLLD